MGLIEWVVKKAVAAKATKEIIRAAADAAVNTIDAVSRAKADSERRAEARAQRRSGHAQQPERPAAAQPAPQVVEIPSVCSKCGANLRLLENRTEVFCEYCGARNYYTAPVGQPNRPDAEEMRSAERIRALEQELANERARRRPEKKKDGCIVTFIKWSFILTLTFVVLAFLLLFLIVAR